MKRKLIICVTVMTIVLLLTGCGKENGRAFKDDYEKMNGVINSTGKVHRAVNISEDNAFRKVEASDIVQMIENKETFYVYFGSKLCPWCRSTIEKADEVSRKRGISKIYYVDIWDDEGNEILRDKMKLDENGVAVIDQEGTNDYKKLLEYFDILLSNYTLTNDKGEKIETGEKRIYAPNYIYVEKGVAKKLITGISSLQKDSREILTEEMLNDEDKAFNDFFTEVCDDAC